MKTTIEPKKFRSATKEGKRVMIAKDVLAQLKMKKLLPTQGAYFRVENHRKIVLGKSLQDVLSNEEKYGIEECECCALGALFTSQICAVNKYKIKRSWISVNEADIRKSLSIYFGKQQLALIECAFEKTTFYADSEVVKGIPEELPKRARRLGLRFRNTENRMKAIMQNIIDNKGTFKP